jgi:hypothetical protein
VVPGTGNLLYSVIALYIPWSVLFCFLPLAGKLLGRLLPLPPISTPAVFVPVIVSGIAASLYAEIMRPLQMDHTTADIRGGLVVMAASYGLASIFRNSAPGFAGGFLRGFLPGLANVLAVLTGLYLWRFVLYLRDIFKTRELFESYTRRCEGAELQRLMLEDSEIMSGADTRMAWVVRMYGFQLFITGVLAVLCSALGIRLSLPFYLFLFLLYLNAVFIFALLNLFKTEHYFAGEGISAAAPERSRRMAAMLSFSLAAAVLAALASADRGILPLSLVAGFFRWFFSLFRREGRPLQGESFVPQSLPAPENPGGMNLRELLGGEESAPWPFWDYLQRLLVVFLVLGLVWFMLKPLFFRAWAAGGLPFPKRIVRIFKGWFSGFLRGLSWFFSSLGKRDNSVGIGPAGRAVRDMTENILAAYSRAKRREIRRGAALFARLILWGNENFQILWKSSLGPGEYCAALSQAALSRADPPPVLPLAAPGRENGAAPDWEGKSAAILRCGEIFEEILYSSRNPGPEIRQEFEEAVKFVTGE